MKLLTPDYPDKSTVFTDQELMGHDSKSFSKVLPPFKHSFKTQLHLHAYSIEAANFNYLTKDYESKREILSISNT
jgi:hypothetical protein